ncbi:MAG: HDOD domain-containing protein [Nitrospirae bacterium]|nr:HDOD domain-containing protein [Nitrospirota bacterium]
MRQNTPEKLYNATIMIIDFSGYVSTDELGLISKVPTLVKKFNDILLKKNNGVVIKVRGKRTLYCFDSAEKALSTALHIKDIVSKYNRINSGSLPVTSMTVLHTEPIPPNETISDDTANRTIFLMSLSSPDEILMSEDTYKLLSPNQQQDCILQNNLVGKGKSGPLKVYKFTWEQIARDRLMFTLPDTTVPDVTVADTPVSDATIAYTPVSYTTVAYSAETKEPSPEMQIPRNILHDKISDNKGFPVLSRTVELLMKLQDNFKCDETSVSELTNTILNDVALTNKLLALVNTIYFSQQDGKVCTISRAFMLLGFIQVRNTALSLMLFKDIHDAGVGRELKKLMVNSLTSAVVAKKIAREVLLVNEEEAFICALLHDLGKMFAAYFVPEENKKVIENITGFHMDEADASRSVLGMSYEELGMSISKDWHLPIQITLGMHKLHGAVAGKPENDFDKLSLLSSFANEFCSLLLSDDLTAEDKQLSLNNLMERYANCFTLSDEYIPELIASLISEMNNYCRIYGIRITSVSIFDRLTDFLEVVRAEQVSLDAPLTPTTIDKPLDTELFGANLVTGSMSAAEIAVQKGLHDVTAALLGDFDVNDIMRIIIEVIYSAMDFTMTIVCVRNAKTNSMEGRFGLGKDAAQVIKDFNFPIEDSTDVFNTAMAKNSNVIVNDVDDIEVKSRIPRWHRNLSNAKTFVILPIVVQDKPFGLIYAEKAELAPIESHNIWNLGTLRKQATIAFKYTAGFKQRK